MNQLFNKIKDFFFENETKIMLFVGFCLVSAISYEFGVLQGQKWQQKPLIIEKPSDTQIGQETAIAAIPDASVMTKTASASQSATKTVTVPNMANCAYVGSKSSNKFYLPTCSYAKRIKPENVVCFKSADEALGQGRTESKCSK
ncbi:MAG: hypothetical protein WCI36_03940 [bacterium]